jgi:hypothetical protein
VAFSIHDHEFQFAGMRRVELTDADVVYRCPDAGCAAEFRALRCVGNSKDGVRCSQPARRLHVTCRRHADIEPDGDER